jgi:hypothetical protein
MTFVSNAECYAAEARNLWLSLQLTLLIELAHTRKHPPCIGLAFRGGSSLLQILVAMSKFQIYLIAKYLSTLMKRKGINGSTDFSKN